MKFLYFLEGIRNPFLDFFFATITHLGEEIFFLGLAIFFFWCVNKREGYYILTVGLMGTVVNQLLKIIYKIPRPWVKDPAFTVVESAVEEATGYSFPSGHTQNVTGTFGAICVWSKRLLVRALSVSLIVLVALSRMYLGVHTPLDVIVSLFIGFILVAALYPVFKTEERFNKFMPYVVGSGMVITVAFAIYCATLSPEGLDPKNYESALKNAATLTGCVVGLAIVYPLDRFVIKFNTSGRWYSQFIKLALGLGIVFLAKEGLRAPLESLVGLFTDSPVYIARSIRYLLIVLIAGAVWPLTFKFFSNLRIEFMERLTLWFKKKLSFISHGTDSRQAEDK